MKQGSEEWKEFRRNKVMASDAPIILGVSPWKTILQLYNDKINGTESIKTPAMQRGHDLEPDARKAFERITGHFVSPKVLVHPVLDWMGASFDGINDQGVVCEIKCSGGEDHGLALRGIVPEKYKPQLQHQMYVAVVSQCYYFSYRPNDVEPCALVSVKADRQFQSMMILKEYQFWEGLQSKTPPEATERDVQVREDRAWLMMEEELLRVINQGKELQMREDQLRTMMIEMCDGRMTKGYRLKLSPISRKGAIDYASIDLLKELDLEMYRKPGTIAWRIDQI